MNKNDYRIRLERKDEHRVVEHLVRKAFWNVYRPGCLEHYVLNQLRSDPAFVPELDYVMEKDGQLIGQNMFMRQPVRSPLSRSAGRCRCSMTRNEVPLDYYPKYL